VPYRLPMAERSDTPGHRSPPLTVEPGYAEEWRVLLHNETVRLKRAEASQRELVGQALNSGATWSEIAKVLQVTRQSAHRRFR
jgi:hypothetical protein